MKTTKNKLTFRQFKWDMRIMYKLKGQKMFKEVGKMLVVVGVVFLLLKQPLNLDWVYVAGIYLMLPLAFLVAYLASYFSDYRPMLEEVREEVRLIDKYPSLYDKFTKTE